LIHVKDSSSDRDEDRRTKYEEDRMPADTLLLSIVICAIFALFAGVLICADLTTSRWIRQQQRGVNRSAPTQKAA
jgi:hypothetical protein